MTPLLAILRRKCSTFQHVACSADEKRCPASVWIVAWRLHCRNAPLSGVEGTLTLAAGFDDAGALSPRLRTMSAEVTNAIAAASGSSGKTSHTRKSAAKPAANRRLSQRLNLPGNLPAKSAAKPASRTSRKTAAAKPAAKKG
ncbi:hypothetical protein [Mobiluncus holmesii]|uniref:hypothetical protein n=1 Tax=Mobiluncus holmesii TaxID=144178 RepID=UPI000E0670C0|nr:hypothetical protein [Mobiluncus holmesii]STY98407.1 Uncharacterised protein [Mobiluncus holmesii]